MDLHKKVMPLVRGEIGSNRGHQVARYLHEIKRLDILDEFFVLFERMPGKYSYVADYLKEVHPDIYAVFVARERILT